MDNLGFSLYFKSGLQSAVCILYWQIYLCFPNTGIFLISWFRPHPSHHTTNKLISIVIFNATQAFPWCWSWSKIIYIVLLGVWLFAIQTKYIQVRIIINRISHAPHNKHLLSSTHSIHLGFTENRLYVPSENMHLWSIKETLLVFIY